MRKISLLVLLLIGSISCKQNQTGDFKVIDYSFSAGDRKINSIKIQENGKIYICSENFFSNSKFFKTFTLENKEIDTLSKLVKAVFECELDTIYDYGCDACFSYSLIIKANNRTLKTSFSGERLSEKSAKTIDIFAIKMNRLFEKYNNIQDSSFIFLSRARVIFPPPAAGADL